MGLNERILANVNTIFLLPKTFNHLVATTCIFVLIISSSYAAGSCTPTYIGEDLDKDKLEATNVVIKEGSSFRMTCHVNEFHNIKWTLNGRELNVRVQDQLGIYLETQPASDGKIFTEIEVFNATKLHNGEYKCTSPCLEGSSGNLNTNTGVKVLVIFGENPQVDGELVQREVAGSSHLVKQLVRYANKQTKAQIKCWANNVKSIEWVKGDQSTKGVAIPACSEKKKNPEPDDIQRDDPCTSKVVTEEVMNGTQRVKEKRLVLKFPWVRTEDIGPYTCTVHPDVSDSNVEPFETTVHLQEQIKRFKRSTMENETEDGGNKIKVFKVERLTTESRHFDKGHRSVTVIAGNTLHIYCNVSGLGTDEKPSAIKMTFYKDGMPLPDYKNERNQTVLLKDKVVIRSEHWFDYLEAESHHRGEYKCEAEHKGIMYNYKFYVRVKDKLLPLWPFLGICGEVAVLCIIIVCYEKRRNKQELEESDTDGSPDQ